MQLFYTGTSHLQDFILEFLVGKSGLSLRISLLEVLRFHFFDCVGHVQVRICLIKGQIVLSLKSRIMLEFWKRALVLHLFTVERCQVFVLHGLHLLRVYDVKLVVIDVIVQRRARILLGIHIQRVMTRLVPLIFFGSIFNFDSSLKVTSLSRPKILIQSGF